MQRIRLVAYQKSVVSPDTAEALRQLEKKAAGHGVRLIYKGSQRIETGWAAIQRNPGPTEQPPHLSMQPAGREARLRIQFRDYNGPPELERELEIAYLWGLAIPLGFTPWARHPTPLAHGVDEVFHFLGPWQRLYDHLCSQGRGELAWSSACAAAQVDINTWEGSKKTERFLQAQLHRIGHPCGPVDGVIGDRTTEVLQGVGVQGRKLEEMAEDLGGFDPPVPSGDDRLFGYIVVPGRKIAVASYEGISHITTMNGVTLAIDGPGRVIVDVT